MKTKQPKLNIHNKHSSVKTYILAFTTMSISWLTTVNIISSRVGLLFNLWIIGLCLWLILLLFLFRRSILVALVTVLFSFYVFMPVFSFIEGCIDYSSGEAKLRLHGMFENNTFFNLDPKLRVYTATTCVLTGFESFTDQPYNLAVQFMVQTFGPMKGMYTGPYPTKKEAHLGIKKSVSIDIKKSKKQGFITIQGKRIKLPPKALVRSSSHMPFDIWGLRLDHSPFKAALYKDTVLLISDRENIILVDRYSKKRFAVYKKTLSPLQVP